MKFTKIKRLRIYFMLFSMLVICFWSCKKSEETTKTVSGLPYFNSADFTPEWNVKKHKIPAFSFTNQNGNIVTNKTYEGKIYVADFFFTTCPGICPKLAKNMNAIQDLYASDNNVMLLSHSVMPWVDTVDKLKDYAEKNMVNDLKWNLVTGNKDELYDIARNGYFADEDFKKTGDEDEFIHTENFILVDKEGYIRGVYNGTIEIEIERLKRHIEILKKES
jgi:protein SCO1